MTYFLLVVNIRNIVDHYRRSVTVDFLMNLLVFLIHSISVLRTIRCYSFLFIGNGQSSRRHNKEHIYKMLIIV